MQFRPASIIARVMTAVSPLLALAALTGAQNSAGVREDYVHVPMPPGIQVEPTELEGPVFADAQGRTLYKWPFKAMRAGGITGDAKDKSACTDEVRTTTAGLMSPYPPGLTLPELDKRQSCVAVWPPALAPDGAQPVGAWSLITRKDGRKQWTYDGHALYTSVLDQAPGDTWGGTLRRDGGDGPAEREPVGPPSAVPPGFNVIGTALGRLLITTRGQSIYTFDKDGPEKSACQGACTQTWIPVAAPATAHAQGDWSYFERAPGVRQWAFRKKPIYIYAPDDHPFSLIGSDVPGWHNVYTQLGPPAPAGFTTQDSDTGVVLADSAGKTIYFYNCGDDSYDQLACDHPDSPQVYRFTICGGGDPVRCVKNWPYVLAEPNARTTSRSWTTMWIDPMTGHAAQPNQSGALHVWAYRLRPVYTYSGDHKPGDTNGNDRGEFGGKRNGFQAFLLRDDYFTNFK